MAEESAYKMIFQWTSQPEYDSGAQREEFRSGTPQFTETGWRKYALVNWIISGLGNDFSSVLVRYCTP